MYFFFIKYILVWKDISGLPLHLSISHTPYHGLCVHTFSGPFLDLSSLPQSSISPPFTSVFPPHWPSFTSSIRSCILLAQDPVICPSSLWKCSFLHSLQFQINSDRIQEAFPDHYLKQVLHCCFFYLSTSFVVFPFLTACSSFFISWLTHGFPRVPSS